MTVEQTTRPGQAGSAAGPAGPEALAGRLGLSIPHGWWATAPLLKSYEAAGFEWVQLHAPPEAVLRVARLTTAHAVAAAAALGTTTLRAVLHSPSELRAGTREGDRAFEGLLSYGAEIGAAAIVYHALALPEGREHESALVAEARSLSRHAAVAERLGLRIAVENLAPLYPGPETVSANPMTLRGLVRRIGSPAVCICLDIGHAHIAADTRNTSVELMVDPVMDLVGVIHVHDNLGARRRPAAEKPGIDPLRLDLHLAPGRGTIAWDRVAPRLANHGAPLICEVHPPYRPRTAELASIARSALTAR